MMGHLVCSGGKTRWTTVLTLLAVTQLGCTDEGAGPGTYTVFLTDATGSVAGAAVVELEGIGFNAGPGLAGTETFFGIDAGTGNEAESARVVVVGSGEPLAFQVHVADVSRGPPTVVVIDVVDVDNEPISPNGFQAVVVIDR